MGRNSNKNRQKGGKDDISPTSPIAAKEEIAPKSVVTTPTAAMQSQGYHVNGNGAAWKNLALHVWRKDNVLVVNLRDETEILTFNDHHGHHHNDRSNNSDAGPKPPAPRSSVAPSTNESKHNNAAAANRTTGTNNTGKSTEIQSYLNDQLAKMRKGSNDERHPLPPPPPPPPPPRPTNNNHPGNHPVNYPGNHPGNHQNGLANSHQNSNSNMNNSSSPFTTSKLTSAPQAMEFLPKVEQHSLTPIPAVFEDPLWGSSASRAASLANEKSEDLDTEQLLSGLLGDLRREVQELQASKATPSPMTVMPPTSAPPPPLPPTVATPAPQAPVAAPPPTMVAAVPPMTAATPPTMIAAPAGSFAVTSGPTTPPMHMAQYVQLPPGAVQAPGAPWGTFMVAQQPPALHAPKGFAPAPQPFPMAGAKFAPGQQIVQFVSPQPAAPQMMAYPQMMAPGKSILMPQGYHIVSQPHPAMYAAGPRPAMALPPGMAMAAPPPQMPMKAVQLVPVPEQRAATASAHGVNIAAAPFVPKQP